MESRLFCFLDWARFESILVFWSRRHGDAVALLGIFFLSEIAERIVLGGERGLFSLFYRKRLEWELESVSPEQKKMIKENDQ